MSPAATPLVTIGIPNYNYARFLRQCVESALGQTHQRVEVLVADNASSDDSIEVLQELRDPRLRWWRNPENLGVYPNWDSLVRAAQGDYFKILQSDDWLEPGFVTTCLEAIDATGSDCAFSGFRVVGDQSLQLVPSDSGLAGRFVAPSRRELAERLWDLTAFIQPTAGLFRSTLVPEGFGGSARNMSRDMVYWSKALTRGRPVFINQLLAVQRSHGAQDRKRRDTSMALGDILDGAEILKDLDPAALSQIEPLSRFYAATFARSAAANLLRGRPLIAGNMLRQLLRHRRAGSGLRDWLLRPRPWRPLTREEFSPLEKSDG